MAKLYPPYIEGTIPAFFESDKGEVKLTTPLSMNKAVGISDVKGFELKIKTAQTGILLGTFKSKGFDIVSKMEAWFDLEDIKNKLTVGQYYKIQIAYIDENDLPGYYSTVGVAKYTSMPTVTIDGLREDIINTHQNKYLGAYSQLNKDITERVYSFRFDLYDINEKIVATSGEILHNRSNDITNYESQDEWSYLKDLETNMPYYIQYTVKTLNNLTVSSPGYRIMQKKTIDPELKVDLVAEMNYDNGFVDLTLVGYINKDTGLEEPVNGSFIILRASDDENYTNWSEVFRFNLNSELPSKKLWKDHTVVQGRMYQYALQQYNDYGLYSNKLLSNIVYSDFEDAYLFDGQRQLKIRYNPKVSSFKNTMYETKIDTIGGKHPFIFRNGITRYKEFPVSGLISYFMDEDELFVTKDKYGLKEITTNHTRENVASERDFKLEVMDWLSDGNVKLFRSPTEGNYLVRLLNVSLTPVEGIGRLLHTFSATAYEIADCTFENLEKYKIIEVEMPKTENLQWQTMNFAEVKNGVIEYVPYGNPFVGEGEGTEVYIVDGDVIVGQKDNKKIEKRYLDESKNLLRDASGNNLISQTMVFNNMMPGDKILIVQKAEHNMTPEASIFVIGATGSYRIEHPVGVSGIYLIDDKLPYGDLLFSYYVKTQNTFNMVTSVDMSEVPVRQFMGIQPSDIEKNKDGTIINVTNQNIIDLIQNAKTDLVQIYQMQFEKRPVEYLYKGADPKKYYKTNDFSIEANLEELDPYYLYEIRKDDKVIAYLDGLPDESYSGDTLVKTYREYTAELYDTKIYIGDNPEVDIYQTERFTLKDFDKIDNLKIGLGVMLTMAYQVRILSYNLESDNPPPISKQELMDKLNIAKTKLNEWETALANCSAALEKGTMTLEEYIKQEQKFRKWRDSRYQEYVETLGEIIKVYKEDNVITV